ncbi:hypothetical protein CAJAP_06331 [Camponotus japonicus]
MAYSQILRSDLQALLDKYREIRDKYAALHVFSEMQQNSLECERKKLEMMKNKQKDMLRWLMKREEKYKISLDILEKENEQLRCALAIAQQEYERNKLLNNNKVSKLQSEIDFLHLQIVQLEDKHKQQLLSQDKHHKDEILKYKRLLDSTEAKLLLREKEKKERDLRMKKEARFAKQNVVSKNVQRTKNTKHPAFINDERKENRPSKVPALEIVNVVRKRRKLFQKDDETVVDII